MRTENSIKNIMTSMFMSVAVIIIGLVSQKVFLSTLGLEYLGINGLFTNIITMLGIAELGLGSAVVYHMYRPLVAQDNSRVRTLINFYKNGYRIIAMIVLAIGLLLMPFLSSIVGEVNVSVSITLVYLLFLSDVVLSYLLTYKRSILYADQKSYLVNLIHLISIIIMNSLQIAVLLLTGDFYLYLIIKIAMRVIENLAISLVVDHRYQYLTTGESEHIDDDTKQDIFKKIKGLLIHKVGSFVVLGSDNIIISIFLGVATVGLYSNYYLVIAAIGMVVGQIFTAITASVGSLLITSNPRKSFEVYNVIRFANFLLATVAATGVLVSMDSFVAVWLGGEYVLATGVLVALSLNLYFQLSRSATNSFKEAAGIFHEDRFVPVLESLVNIVLSVMFLHIFGLVGVFIGTICSNLVLHLFSYPRYVYTRLFERSYTSYYYEFMKHLCLAIAVSVVTMYFSRLITADDTTLQLVFSMALSILMPSAILIVVYRNSPELTYLRVIAKKTISKRGANAGKQKTQ